MKKYLIILMLSMLFIITGCSEDSSFTIDEVQIDAQIQEDVRFQYKNYILIPLKEPMKVQPGLFNQMLKTFKHSQRQMMIRLYQRKV